MSSELCVICPGKRRRRSEPESHVCWVCLEKLRTVLREIEDYTATLSPYLTGGGGGVRPPGYASRTPGNDDVIVALDYRSHPGASVHRLRDPRYDSDNPIRSILGTLHGITQWIRDERCLTTPPEPPTVTSEIRFLLAWIDWTAGHTVTDQHGNPHPCIDDIAGDLRELHRQVRGMSPLGARLRKVGRCPEKLEPENEDDEPKACGAAVFAPLTGDTAYCAAGHQWTRERWLWLGTLMEAAG